MITINDVERDGKTVNDFTERLLGSLKDVVSFVKIDCVDDLNGIEATLNQLSKVLSYYVKVEKSENDIHFARGRLTGVSEIYQSLLALGEKAERHSHSVDDVFAAIKTVSHGDEVLNSLSLSRGIQHKELSEIIDVDVSTLTGIMDKLINLKLVYFTKVGKFKFYYLSEFGQSYKDEKKVQPQMYIKDLELQLQKEKERIRLLESEYVKLLYYSFGKNRKPTKTQYVKTAMKDIYKINKKESNEEKSESVLSSIFDKENPFNRLNRIEAFI